MFKSSTRSAKDSVAGRFLTLTTCFQVIHFAVNYCPRDSSCTLQYNSWSDCSLWNFYSRGGLKSKETGLELIPVPLEFCFTNFEPYCRPWQWPGVRHDCQESQHDRAATNGLENLEQRHGDSESLAKVQIRRRDCEASAARKQEGIWWIRRKGAHQMRSCWKRTGFDRRASQISETSSKGIPTLRQHENLRGRIWIASRNQSMTFFLKELFSKRIRPSQHPNCRWVLPYSRLRRINRLQGWLGQPLVLLIAKETDMEAVWKRGSKMNRASSMLCIFYGLEFLFCGRTAFSSLK